MGNKQPINQDDDNTLVFQDLTPEKPANVVQKSIIHLQRHWPPHWNKHHLVLFFTVLSGLLIFFLVMQFIQPATQQNTTTNETLSTNVIVTMNVSQMLAYEKIIYVIKTPLASTVGTLEALNSQTGSLIWKDTQHHTEALKVVGNILYVQTATKLVALDAGNRTQLWEKQTLADNYDWQIDQGILFIAATNGRMTALNAQTGAQLWQNRQQSSFWAVDNGIFYSKPLSGLGLSVLNAYTGTLLWYNPTIDQDLTINNGMVYLQDGTRQKLEALDGRNGKVRWQISIQGKDFKLSAHDGCLLLSDLVETNVEALNGQTGTFIWQRQGIINSLTEIPDQTVISSLRREETDIIRTEDGTTLYHFPRTDALLSIKNDLAFFINFGQNTSAHNFLYNYITNIDAVSLSTGATLWSNQSREEFPLLQHNTIGIIPISSNSLLLLRDDNGRAIWQHIFDTTGN